MKTKRVEFVKSIQALLRETDTNDVTLKYGYKDTSGVFHESETDVNTDADKYEGVLIKYDRQSDQFGRFQSIEGDGLFWILKDVIESVNKL